MVIVLHENKRCDSEDNCRQHWTIERPLGKLLPMKVCFRWVINTVDVHYGLPTPLPIHAFLFRKVTLAFKNSFHSNSAH